jgi:hypothetical protein
LIPRRGRYVGGASWGRPNPSRAKEEAPIGLGSFSLTFLEHAQQIAAHESPRTTKLYDRTSDQITLDEIERIAI